MLFAQGIGGHEPRNKDRRDRPEALRTGDGCLLPHHLKALVLRELDVIGLLNRQIETVKAERDALLADTQTIGAAPAPVRMLLELKGTGPGFAGTLWSEGPFRRLENGRQVAACAGLAPTPWKSGTINHEQGVSKAGNPRLPAIAAEMKSCLIRSSSCAPYVKRGKTDAADAEAICEAVTRPRMRFVPVKSEEIQGAAMVSRVRELLIRQRTQAINDRRGHLIPRRTAFASPAPPPTRYAEPGVGRGRGAVSGRVCPSPNLRNMYNRPMCERVFRSWSWRAIGC